MASIAGAILVLAGVIGMSFGNNDDIGSFILLVGAIYLIAGMINSYEPKTRKD